MDGTRHLLFEALELLEKLPSLTPRPRINLILYHGVLAPHAGWRARVVAYDGPMPAATVPAPRPLDGRPSGPAVRSTPRHWPWAKLMQRALEIDVLACQRCGGRLRLIATVEDPREIREVLEIVAREDAPMNRAPPSNALRVSPVAPGSK